MEILKKLSKAFSLIKVKMFGFLLGNVFQKQKVESGKFENGPLGLITPTFLLKRIFALVVVVSTALIGLGWCLAYLLTGKIIFSVGATFIVVGIIWRFLSSLKKEDCFTNIPKAYGGLITIFGKRICREFPYILPTGEAKSVNRGWETTEGDIPTLQKLFKGIFKATPMNKELQTFSIPPIAWLAKDGEVSFEITVAGQVSNLHQAIEIMGGKLSIEKMENIITVYMTALAKSLITSKTIDEARNGKDELQKDILDKLSLYEPFLGFNFFSVLVQDTGASPERTKAIEKAGTNRLNAEADKITFEIIGEIPIIKKLAKIDPALAAKMQLGILQPGAFKTQSFDIGGLPPGILGGIAKVMGNLTKEKI